MIRYYRLFEKLDEMGLKKTDLLKVISPPTLAKLSKGESITTAMIDKICEYLQCQPGDIMEHYTVSKIDGKNVEMYTMSKKDMEEYMNQMSKEQEKAYNEYERRERILNEYAPKETEIINDAGTICAIKE